MSNVAILAKAIKGTAQGMRHVQHINKEKIIKKLILILIISLIPAKVMSANFVDALGSECARILLNMDLYEYPKYYEQFENRNSQFYALEQCLKVYKQSGGNIEELNKKYSIAKEITEYDLMLCLDNKKDGDKKCEINHFLFKDIIEQSPCETQDFVTNNYPNVHFKSKPSLACIRHNEKIKKKIAKELKNESSIFSF